MEQRISYNNGNIGIFPEQRPKGIHRTWNRDIFFQYSDDPCTFKRVPYIALSLFGQKRQISQFTTSGHDTSGGAVGQRTRPVPRSCAIRLPGLKGNELDWRGAVWCGVA